MQVMEYGKVFKRAWHNMRHYRALWIFGVILALTTFSWEWGIFTRHDNDNDASSRGIEIVRQPDETFFEAFWRTMGEEVDRLEAEIEKANQDIEEFFVKELNVEVESDLLAVIVMLAGLMLTGFIVAKIAGYVADAALIRMVNETEETGEQFGARQGLRMGWSRAAWRFFLIDVLVDLSAILAFVAVLVLVLAPLALWATGSTLAGVIGTILSVGLFFPTLALVIVAAAALSLLKKFARRACAVDGLGVTASVRQGYAVVRRHLKALIPIWLVTVGVKLVWPLLMVPVVIVSIGVGLVVGGFTGLLVGGLAGLAAGGATPWVLGAFVGIGFFILTLVAPLVFLGGLREVFLSNTWTLTYRELGPLESAEPGRLIRLDPSGLKAAPLA
jgi:hypothetical protein